jgi:hypothetical protein
VWTLSSKDLMRSGLGIGGSRPRLVLASLGALGLLAGGNRGMRHASALGMLSPQWDS